LKEEEVGATAIMTESTHHQRFKKIFLFSHFSYSK
jgi:hypothetical protein